MKSEEITKDDIMRISRLFGSGLRNEAEIENALYAGRGRSLPRRVAYLWRAILVSGPFMEGDKKTALAVAGVMLGPANDSLVAAIIRITNESIASVDRIERLIRYAVERSGAPVPEPAAHRPRSRMQGIERILKENRRYTDMLGYYDSTGKLPTKKLLRSFTLKQINFDKLKAESQRTGKNMSRLLDEMIEKNIAEK